MDVLEGVASGVYTRTVVRVRPSRGGAFPRAGKADVAADGTVECYMYLMLSPLVTADFLETRDLITEYTAEINRHWTAPPLRTKHKSPWGGYDDADMDA